LRNPGAAELILQNGENENDYPVNAELEELSIKTAKSFAFYRLGGIGARWCRLA
jgi:hypothetical protein